MQKDDAATYKIKTTLLIIFVRDLTCYNKVFIL